MSDYQGDRDKVCLQFLLIGDVLAPTATKSTLSWLYYCTKHHQIRLWEAKIIQFRYRILHKEQLMLHASEFMVPDFLYLPLLWSLQCLLARLGHTAAFLFLRAPILSSLAAAFCHRKWRMAVLQLWQRWSRWVTQLKHHFWKRKSKPTSLSQEMSLPMLFLCCCKGIYIVIIAL